jgi:hypothetical protein
MLTFHLRLTVSGGFFLQILKLMYCIYFASPHLCCVTRWFNSLLDFQILLGRLNKGCLDVLHIYTYEVTRNLCKIWKIKTAGNKNLLDFGENFRIVFLLLLFVLGPLAYFPSELILNHGFYIYLVGLLGRVVSPVARPLPT